jgi:hypothetical protein
MQRWNLSAWAIHHPALVLALLIACALGGFYAYLGLGRAEDPSFTAKTAIVTAAWPGATAQQMADQVADPMEKKLRGLPWIDFVQTYTVSGFAVLMVYLQDATPAHEVPEQFYQLRKKLDDLRPDLPPGIVGPAVNDEFSEIDNVLYAVTGEGADYPQLKLVAEALGKRLERVAAVEKIDYYGEQAQRIWIEFSHAKLATLGIPPQALFDSLTRQNAVAPAGVVETEAQRIPLRVTGAIDGLGAVAETPVAAGGRIFRHRQCLARHRGPAAVPDPGAGQAGGTGRRGDAQRQRHPAPGRRPARRPGRVPGQPAGRLLDPRDRRPAAGGGACSRRVHALVSRGADDRAGRKLLLARLARRAGGHRGGATRAGGGIPGDVADRHRLATHLARRVDHRARATGGRCDHRGGDDGGEAGGRLAEAARRRLRLDLHGVSHADRNAGDRGGVPADRPGALNRR